MYVCVCVCERETAKWVYMSAVCLLSGQFVFVALVGCVNDIH